MGTEKDEIDVYLDQVVTQMLSVEKARELVGGGYVADFKEFEIYYDHIHRLVDLYNDNVQNTARSESIKQRLYDVVKTFNELFKNSRGLEVELGFDENQRVKSDIYVLGRGTTYLLGMFLKSMGVKPEHVAEELIAVGREERNPDGRNTFGLQGELFGGRKQELRPKAVLYKGFFEDDYQTIS